MYIKAYTITDAGICLTDYAAIEALSFAPSADLSGASVPVNGFEADIRTGDDIEVGANAELYDDMDALWASYWVVEARRLSPQVIRIRAESDVALLERVALPSVYYDNRSAAAVIGQLMGGVQYRLDARFESATLTGFCPAQTARERLLWVTFILGATVKSCFNDRLEILPAEGGAIKRIPEADTYWRPRRTCGDWVTALRAVAYSFAAGDPEPGQKYVTSATGVNYIVTETEVILQNPNAPLSAPENIISVEGMYLLNANNASAVLGRLAQWYFGRERLDIDAIDNGTIHPGDRVTAVTAAGEMVSGYVTRAAFRFGTQAMASLKLTAVETLPGANLAILYLYEGMQISRADYTFPVGFSYAVDNPWFDVEMGGARYVFCPVNPRAEGTMAEGENVNRQALDVALELIDGVLRIAWVDSVSDRGSIG